MIQGNEVSMEALVDMVIGQIVEDLESNDLTALSVLLEKLPVDDLKGYLREYL